MIVNLKQHRITWEGYLSEKLSRFCWMVSVALRDFHVVDKDDKTHPKCGLHGWKGKETKLSTGMRSSFQSSLLLTVNTMKLIISCFWQ